MIPIPFPQQPSAPSAPAAPPAPVVPAATTHQLEAHSLGDYFVSTGVVGPVLVVLFVTAVVLTIRRWRALASATMAPESLQRHLEIAVRQGEAEQTLAQARASRSLLGDLVAAGLQMRGAGLDDMLANCERAAIKESLERQARAVVVSRLGTTILLLSIAGTVTGLMSTMAVVSAMKDPAPNVLLVGIGESLASTAIGLVFALACYQLHGMLSSRAVTRLLAIRTIAEELLIEAARPRP